MSTSDRSLRNDVEKHPAGGLWAQGVLLTRPRPSPRRRLGQKKVAHDFDERTSHAICEIPPSSRA